MQFNMLFNFCLVFRGAVFYYVPRILNVKKLDSVLDEIVFKWILILIVHVHYDQKPNTLSGNKKKLVKRTTCAVKWYRFSWYLNPI